ncbi:MAG: RNA methyltransferase [Streptococcaceae bacterium]|jgi:TrmH family RNA methyltransferase|nr:RNA methyltransferase [Streptococcaceae bacterium]
MKKITSKTNEKIKQIKKLLQNKHRTDSYLIEGIHLVEEAIQYQATIQTLVFTEKFAEQFEDILPNTEKIITTAEVLQQLTEVKTPQGIVAVISKPKDWAQNFSGNWLVLDRVQDPGNVGTMIRTADAAGVSGVIISKDSVDIYNPKVLRSMQGSHFHLPIVEAADLPLLLQQLAKTKILLVSTLSMDSIDYHKLNIRDNWLLVMGNEGSGVTQKIQDLADMRVHISMNGAAESLNFAVATGILIFYLIKL